jgi:hypothetical protein
MKGYAKSYIRKISDIVTLGMQNEGYRKYLDVQSVIGRIGLVRAFEISVKSRTLVKRRYEQNFWRHESCFL